jgi:hypothetical protein
MRLYRILSLIFKASALTVLLLTAPAPGFVFGVGAARGPHKVLAEVGGSLLTLQEVTYRAEIEKAYGETGADITAALVSMVNDLIEEEVAHAHGLSVTREEVASFSKHVDENTKASEILEKVKALFGQDVDAYERIYLRPRLMNRKIRYYYSRNPEIHAAQRAQIEKAFRLAASGRPLRAAAEECRLRHAAFEIEDGSLNLPPLLSRYSREEEVLKNPLLPLIERLSEGELFKDIVEDDRTYRVIKLIAKKPGKYSLEAVVAEKEPFDRWLEAEARKLRIVIKDRSLKKTITEKYHDAWWMLLVEKTD